MRSDANRAVIAAVDNAVVVVPLMLAAILRALRDPV